MLTLRYSSASPYARKVRIAADLLGLAGRIQISTADTADPNDPIRAQNPLGKIPTLLLEHGLRSTTAGSSPNISIIWRGAARSFPRTRRGAC
jgi:glutathione S-transferase